MCEHQGDFSHQLALRINGETIGVDACIAELVQTLNNAGFQTIASCCGHGNRPGSIALADGRELIIAKDYENARKVDRCFPDIHGQTAHYMVIDYTSDYVRQLEAQNVELKQIAVNFHWMARRYADGRCTYAPGMVNEAVRKLQAMGVELNLGAEHTPWARDGMGPGFSGLSKAEYELGEPLNGWNGLVKTEEMEALCRLLKNREDELLQITSAAKKFLLAENIYRHNLELGTSTRTEVLGAYSAMKEASLELSKFLKTLNSNHKNPYLSKRPYLGKPPRRQCDYEN